MAFLISGFWKAGMEIEMAKRVERSMKKSAEMDLLQRSVPLRFWVDQLSMCDRRPRKIDIFACQKDKA